MMKFFGEGLMPISDVMVEELVRMLRSADESFTAGYSSEIPQSVSQMLIAFVRLEQR
jgi:hypothetical protein